MHSLWLSFKNVFQHFSQQIIILALLPAIQRAQIHYFRNIKQEIFVQYLTKYLWRKKVFLKNEKVTVWPYVCLYSCPYTTIMAFLKHHELHNALHRLLVMAWI